MIFRLAHKHIFRFSLSFALVVLGALICRQLVEAAWTPPLSGAPGGNVAPPLNTSGLSQTKQGSLTLGGTLALTNDDLLFHTTTKGVFWGAGLFSEPHLNFSADTKRLYLSPGENANSGVELQGNTYITSGGDLYMDYFRLQGGCDGNNTIKADATGKLICQPDLTGSGGTIDGTGQTDKVAVFQDFNTLTFDNLFHWNSSDDFLGIGTANPQANLHVDGSIRLDSPALQNCNTLDTDINGNLVCGPDNSGGNSYWENGTTLNTINPVDYNVTKVAIGHNNIPDATTLSVINNSINSTINGEQNNANGYAGYFSGKTAVMNGNMGIGDTSPASALTVGNGDLFQVNASGDITRVRGVPYSWPGAQGAANSFLQNDGAGTLSWATGGLSGNGVATRVAFWTGISQLDSNANLYWDNTNNRLGIGDASPAATLTVGSGDLFQVNNSGNLIRIKNIAYSWPVAQGAANTFLQNNGSGSLSWASLGADTNLIKVTNADTTPDTLQNKLVAGANITIEKINPGADEKLKISAAPGGGLPAGSSGQTLRHDGTTWLATSNLYNNGTSVGVSQTNPTGVFVVNHTQNGVGSAGDAIATYANTANSALYAQQTNATGYAGYLSGKAVVMSGKLGISTNSPDQKFTQVGGNMVHRPNLAESPQMLDKISWLGNHLGEGVYVSGEYAYVMHHNSSFNEFHIIDVHNPLDIQEVGSLNLGGWENGQVAVAGRYAYALVDNVGVKIIDVSRPSNPTLVGTYADGAVANGGDLVVQGKYLFVGSGNGFKILDISNPAAPSLVSTFNGGGGSHIYVAGRYLYTDTFIGDRIFRIIDLNNIAAPVQVGSLDLGGAVEFGLAIQVLGRYAYVGTAEPGMWRLKVIDISNPAAPVQVGELADGVTPTDDIFVQGHYAYVTGGWGGAFIVDISDPLNPVRTSAKVNMGTNAPEHIFVSGKYAYYAYYGSEAGNEVGGIAIVDISGLGNPAINAGNIETGQLSVYENVNVGNDVYVQNSMNVGPRGIKADGPVQGGDIGFWNRFNFTERGEDGLALVSPDNREILSTSDYSVGISAAPSVTFRLTVGGDVSVSRLWQTVDNNSESLQNALSKIQALSVYSYTDTSTGTEQRRYGINSDDLKQVLPETVITDPSGDTYVSYTHLVPVLVQAINEQQAKIAELKKKLE